MSFPPGARPARRLAAVCLVLLLAACTGAPTPPGPSLPSEPLDPVVAQVVTGLGDAELGTAPIDDPERAEADLAVILQGMDDITPEVTTGPVREDGATRWVRLSYTWPLPGGAWSYDVEAPFVGVDGAWRLQWSPAVVHPQLTENTRLVHTLTPAPRADIVGRNSQPLMTRLPVLRLGLDKTQVKQAQVKAAAGRLADFLDIDKAAFVARAEAAGEKAFVEALVVRGSRDQVSPSFADIPGAMIVDDQQVLAVERGLAGGLLGTVGDATAEIIDASKGTVFAGEEVGLTGLQQRYDEQLRGTPGSQVRLVGRPQPSGSPSPRGSASPGASSSSPASSPAASPSAAVEPVELFAAEPTPGEDLSLTLDLALQRKAERVLGPITSPTAMAVVQASTGEVRVLATSGSAKGEPLANFGRYAPGSTFKVVTALALLRAGLNPNSPVDCPQTTVVDGRRIKNYDDFPASRVGRMRLIEAVALSCNTAFVNERARVTPEALREAATSLGLGQDHDAGFPAFYGSVPDPTNEVGQAESLFGQGTVEASPMAMAGVAASVAAGRTTVPYLVTETKPKQAGTALSAAEAEQLRSMMGAVVTAGSASKLRGVVTGAKTGTAEYGTDTPPKTHAWMIAYVDDLAIAVMVSDGDSGSGTAGPLIQQFLAA